jgi:cupin fold WbuC family metalloprotein
MTKMTRINGDVYITAEQFPSAGREEIKLLADNVGGSSRGRIRLCMHKSNEDRMHEMLIAFTASNYIRPSWHLGKDESLHMLQGDGDYLFFDENGDVIDSVPLGTYSSENQFYCRIPASCSHSLVIRSGDIVVHETTVGPFQREDTVFAQWSPEENNSSSVAALLEKLKRRPRSARKLLEMKQQSEEVYVANENIVSVGRKEMDFLKAKVPHTARKRVRLCAHKDTDNTLHEMFVVYTSMTYVKPNKHLNKDESLHILEGEADFIFFNDAGQIVEIIPLGDYNSGRQFYIRVPAFVYHTIIMKSESLVIHEATPGPFVRADTIWAPWAPEETDANGVARFMNSLQTAVKA